MRLLPRMMFDDFFDDMFDEPLLHRNAVTAMRCDIREKDGSYLLDIELPGCKKEDIKMDLEDGYLTVSAVRDTRKEERMIRATLSVRNGFKVPAPEASMSAKP